MQCRCQINLRESTELISRKLLLTDKANFSFLFTAANVRIRHIMGWLQHHRSDEFQQVHEQTNRISRRKSNLPPGHRCESIEEKLCTRVRNPKCTNSIALFQLLMLTTNMIRKDLNATNQYDAGVALSGLSCFISPDLSRDLGNDIMTLMSSTKPYLRMKAVLMMYKVFLNYPEALKPAFPKLKEKLEDPDPGVQSAAVNVICELARKNPKNYLSLAPIFFKLMTTSSNNWMLIKIIKLVS